MIVFPVSIPSPSLLPSNKIKYVSPDIFMGMTHSPPPSLLSLEKQIFITTTIILPHWKIVNLDNTRGNTPKASSSSSNGHGRLMFQLLISQHLAPAICHTFVNFLPLPFTILPLPLQQSVAIAVQHSDHIIGIVSNGYNLGTIELQEKKRGEESDGEKFMK